MNQTLSKTDNGSAFIKVLCILAIIGSIGAIILDGACRLCFIHQSRFYRRLNIF